jgi:Flp pilus assembly protein TadD
LYAALLIVLICGFAYSNTLDAGFVFDDSHHIVGNKHLQSTDHSADYFVRADMFSSLPGHHMYRPVLLLTFAWNYHLGGYDPLVWRLTAIALHALVAVGVYLLVHSLLASLDQRSGSGGEYGALVAALVFAVHPVFTETVDYASARSSLLATAGVVWAMLVHRAAVSSTRRPARFALLVLSLAIYALAFLSKEIAIVYPALLLLIGWLERRGRLAVAPAIALTVFLLVVRKFVLGAAVLDFAAREAHVAIAEPGSGGARPILWNLFTQTRVIVAYLAMFLVPQGLCVYRHVRVSNSPLDASFLGSAALLLGLLVVAFRQRRVRPLLTLGILWFLIALAPTSSIIPLNQIMNEHRLYLPGVGAAIVLAFGARRFGWALPRLRAPALCFSCTVLLLLTWERNEDWVDPLRLWESAVRVSPESSKAWNSVGAAREACGDDDGAEAAYHQCLDLDARSWEATFNLATLALRRGRLTGDHSLFEEAARYLDRSLELKPGAERSLWYLAEVRYEQGRTGEAKQIFTALGVRSEEVFEMTRFPLAQLAIDAGEFERARAYYRQALEINVDPVAARLGLAKIDAREGNMRAAVDEAKRAIKDRPRDHRPYLFLARRFAGSPQAARLLLEAEARGYQPTAEQRMAIIRGDGS